MSLLHLEQGQKHYVRHKAHRWIGTLELTYVNQMEDVSTSSHFTFNVTRGYMLSIFRFHPHDGSFQEDPHISSLDELEPIDEWVYDRMKAQAETYAVEIQRSREIKGLG